MLTSDEGECPLPIVVLISGHGSNLQAIIDAWRSGRLPIEIRCVISNRDDAYGLERAREAGITDLVVPSADYARREDFDEALARSIDHQGAELIVMAGFMRILGQDFVTKYAGRILNIHPSLLPRYRGLHTHRRVLEAGDRVHGASIHFVTAELDGGPVIIQTTVPVLEGDDETSLSARVQEAEHIMYPKVIEWMATGRLEWRDGGPWMDGKVLREPVQWQRGITEPTQ